MSRLALVALTFLFSCRTTQAPDRPAFAGANGIDGRNGRDGKSCIATPGESTVAIFCEGQNRAIALPKGDKGEKGRDGESFQTALINGEIAGQPGELADAIRCQVDFRTTDSQFSERAVAIHLMHGQTVVKTLSGSAQQYRGKNPGTLQAEFTHISDASDLAPYTCRFEVYAELFAPEAAPIALTTFTVSGELFLHRGN